MRKIVARTIAAGVLGLASYAEAGAEYSKGMEFSFGGLSTLSVPSAPSA